MPRSSPRTTVLHVDRGLVGVAHDTNETKIYRVRPRSPDRRLGPERQPVVARPLSLSLGQLRVALVVGVVHEVVDGIEARLAGARVLRPVRRAAAGRDALGRGVVDLVALRVTGALERVVEPEPVAGLVYGREAKVKPTLEHVRRLVHRR